MCDNLLYKDQGLTHIRSDAPLICRTATSCPIALIDHSRGFVQVQLMHVDRRGTGNEPAPLTRLLMSFKVISSRLLVRVIACPLPAHRGQATGRCGRWQTRIMTDRSVGQALRTLANGLSATALLAMVFTLGGCATSRASRAAGGDSSEVVRSTSTTVPTTTTTLPVPPSTSISIDRTTVAVGSIVRVSGADCPPGDKIDSHIIQAFTSTATFRPPFEDHTVTAAADRSWSFTATVPMLNNGNASLEATCGAVIRNGSYPVTTYVPIPIVVTRAAQLIVAQGTVITPGTMLTITTTTGPTCLARASAPHVSLEDLATGQTVAWGTPTTGPGGTGPGGEATSWPVSLPVPTDAAPGQYLIGASCDIHGGYPEGYILPVTITIR